MWLFKTSAKSNIQVYQQWLPATLIAVSLAGCASFGWSQGSPSIQPVGLTLSPGTIAALKQAPNVNAIVQIKGHVGASVPLLGKTAYELQDTTGSIWVIATDSIPNSGDEVVLEGKLLYQTIQLNGKEQGSVYLEQQRQLQRTPALKSDRRSIGTAWAG